MPIHPQKEVYMAASKLLKVVLLGSLIAVMLIIVAIISCDKRTAISNPNDSSQPENIGNILVNLNPSQIRLPSREATDTVVISIAVMDSQGVGMQGIRVAVTRVPSIGFITRPDTTDANGRTSAVFVAEPGVYDTTRIKVSAGTFTRSALLNITGPTSYTLHLTFSPPVPKLIDHEGAPYTLTATLVDSTQRGVSGQPVTFGILNAVGRIGFSDSTITTPRTDSRGIVEALFYNTQVDELLPDTVNVARVQALTAASEGGYLLAAMEIPLRRVHNTLTLETASNNVYGDGTDSTIVRAFLLDTDGHGIIDDTVYFSNPQHNGSVGAVRVTDDNGMAVTAFHPYGRVNVPTASQIQAEYRRGSLVHEATALTNITILPIRSIGFITVSLQKQNITANGTDSSMIFITVQDSTGALIADGTTILLGHSGTGQLSTPEVQTTAGQATARIKAPNSIVGPASVKIDTIFVRGEINDSTSVNAMAIVNYVPGPISHLEFVWPTEDVTLVAGSGMIDSVKVAAVDANNNPVANGTQVRFRNEVATSSLTPQAAATSEGIARSIYLIGSLTGDDNVIAFVPNPSDPNDTIRTSHPVVFRCVSSTATTLELGTTQTNIEVGGASTQIIATLQDAYGNPLHADYYVNFDITVAPGDRAILHQRPSFNTQTLIEHDTVLTNINGQAIVQLYSGTVSGAVSIRACTIPMPPESLYVCNEKSLVTISSGPPAFINITYSNSGDVVGGAERFVQVSAIVGDRYANPVQYGTAVYFSLNPPSIADIEGNSITGGTKSYHPDSTNGVAPTRILYGCDATFDTIQIISSSAGDSADITEISPWFYLPIYQGSISLSALPGNLRTDNDSCECHRTQYYDCKDTANITATLIDGGGCLIKGGIIQFSAITAGEILGQQIDTTDVNGHAYAVYVIHGCEIPPLPDGTGARVEAQVRAVLLQKQDVIGEITIVSTRPL
jgi:hypothetical protein